MKPRILFAFSFLLSLFSLNNVIAQTISASNYLIAQPVPDRTVYFGVADAGVYKPITFGLDLAWLDGNNVRRGIAFMGKERVKIIRSSFMTTNPLVGDTALQGDALLNTNKRMDIISNYMGLGTNLMLNLDAPTIDASFNGNPVNWTKLMKVTAKYHEKRGFKVVCVAPFNEPDNPYAAVGTVQDFVNINTEVRKDSYFNGKRLSGPNTLNNDVFFNWYNPMKNQVDEGNTHQLAGSFDNYALIFQTLRANGQMATNDELHNVMEAMVGVEYGLQTGIWWGTAELARGEFCKASDGVRLGYAEHRPYWTSASVYRGVDGRVQAFGGMSERQSATTTYRFVSKDRDVYYDGYGPQREYTMVLPGGLVGSYSNGQTSAERVVNITWGADIQPVINGTYKLVNRKSGKVLQVSGGSTALGTYFIQSTNNGATYQQWNITPLDAKSGGDFSYFKISNVSSGLSPDVLNFSLNNGGSIIAYNFIGVNQQWYFEYAGDGWFYIRSRQSNKCMEVANGSIAVGATIQQWDKNGGTNQQWRLLPINAPIEFIAPGAPTNLTVTNQSTSVRLDWAASPETDVAGYTVFRADSANGIYNTIARNVKSTAFVDNTTFAGKQYFYAVKAVDNSLNSSNYSNQVSTTGPNNKDLVVQLKFNNTTMDSTINLNHGACYGTATYVEGKEGSAVSFNGTTSFIQLPPTIANTNEITIAAWVYWKSINAGQRIFDFGNEQNEYMYLTPRSASSKLCFAIKKNGTEKIMNSTSMLPVASWTHVAITINSAGTTLYVNGKQVANYTTLTTTPLDIKPIFNYIGRGQTSTDPLFNGNIDDFRIYNYALSGNEVGQIAGIISDVKNIDFKTNLSLFPVPANDILHINLSEENSNRISTINVFDINGRLVLHKLVDKVNAVELNVANLTSGIYILKITNNEGIISKRFSINH
jgi:hypothetical protein